MIAAMLNAAQAAAAQNRLVQGQSAVALAPCQWRRAAAMTGRVDCGFWQRGTCRKRFEVGPHRDARQ
jgi:hypothetical protein